MLPPHLSLILLWDGSSQFVAAGFRLSRTWHSSADCSVASYRPDITCSERHSYEVSALHAVNVISFPFRWRVVNWQWCNPKVRSFHCRINWLEGRNSHDGDFWVSIHCCCALFLLKLLFSCFVIHRGSSQQVVPHVWVFSTRWPSWCSPRGFVYPWNQKCKFQKLIFEKWKHWQQLQADRRSCFS